MELRNGVKGNVCKDIFFTESEISGVTPIKHVHVEISRQNSNLTEVKERMAQEVKILGANASALSRIDPPLLVRTDPPAC